MLALDFEQQLRSFVVRRVVISGSTKASGTVEYEFPDYTHLPEPSVIDGPLFAVLFVAMAEGQTLQVNGPISLRALRNAQQFMEAWAKMRPDLYRVVDIRPQSVVTDVQVKDGASIAAYSGGLDATFMMLREAVAKPTAYRPDAVVILNVNVMGNEGRDFERLHARLLPFVKSMSVDPIVVVLNRGPLATQNWYATHAAEIASVLHAFSHRFDFGLLASTAPYDRPVVSLGSSPATDYLLSGSEMALVHEGAGFSRTEKAELVGANELAKSILQVCWQGADRAANCGVCLKCVLTRLNFIAAGHGDIAAFPGNFTPEMLDGFDFHSPAAAAEFVGLLDYAGKKGISDPWVKQLQDKLDRTL